jgi:hypothetical protein
MTIAILEICASTHYTLINALVKTYCTDPRNTVTVYTLPNIAKSLREGGMPDRANVVVLEGNTDVGSFLKNIEKTAWDRLHICTIEDHYEAFNTFKPTVKDLFFHIHDIDIWFENSISNRFKNLIFDLKNAPAKVRSVARFMKDILVRRPLKNSILNGLLGSNPYYIVMSNRLKNNLSPYVDAEKIVVFPTLINEGAGLSTSKKSGKIRLCIPGIVTDGRRDYTGLFKILDSILPQIKNSLAFDFLGFVDKKELHLMDKIKELEQRGLEVTYSLDFVDVVTFDKILDSSDILLNNQTMSVSHTGQYGQTKESGMIFNIVRGAKPAIFPSAYAVDAEFEDVLLYYNSADSLKDILLGLATQSIDIEQLKANAAALGQAYTPKNLYSRLVKEAVAVT